MGGTTINIQIREESFDALPEYGQVSIAFEVKSFLEIEVVDQGLGGFILIERKVAQPYRKDYDTDNGEGPTRWLKRFDLANWGILVAFDGDTRVGGCAIAWNIDGIHMLEGRKDLAVLWDLRVDPAYRRKGGGTRLFNAAVAWAAERECRVLKIETQNVNVTACRFYAKHGCVLGSINRFAYAEFPNEAELCWYLKIRE